MNQELVPAADSAPALLPARHLGAAANVGAVAIEQERAIAETQGKLVLAKRFPRSMAGATADFLDACASPEFARAAFYSVPNRGSGPSIRFAEEVARCYGNFDYGHKELSRDEGKSEVEVYAWDMEKNNYSRRQITVMHQRDTKNGPQPLRDQADIDNRIANIASKQVRGRILALVPKALVAAGIEAAKRTLAGGGDKPISQRVTDMTVAFSKFGVTAEMLVAHLGHSLDDTNIDELADMSGIYNAIKEGAKVGEFFGSAAKEEGTSGGAALAAAGQAKDEPKPEAPKTTPKEEQKPQQETKAEDPKPQQEEKKAPPAEETKTADPPPAETKTEAAAQPAATSGKAVF